MSDQRHARVLVTARRDALARDDMGRLTTVDAALLDLLPDDARHPGALGPDSTVDK